MPSFHADPNVVISIFRLILDGLKEFRTRRGQSAPDKAEEALKEGVKHAEEMSAKGASADEVVSAIQTKLERDLGPVARDEIIGRASSILSLTEPFEIGAFEYHKNLRLILERSRDYCVSTNIFKLRGEVAGDSTLLTLPRVADQLTTVLHNFRDLTSTLEGQGVITVRADLGGVYLSTRPEALNVSLKLHFVSAAITGGTYTNEDVIGLALTRGREPNRIGFHIIVPSYSRSSNFPYRYLYKDFDARLTSAEFQAIVSAVLTDVSDYAAELAKEQKDFREQIAPALAALLSLWPANKG